jgi:RHS repeat-associated protein
VVTQYYHLDVLGSVRAVTDASGALVRRHDYLAFGEDVASDEPQALPALAKQQRFTGKERDFETYLDYFGARYYRNVWGRFTTVDPDHVGGNIFDPQSWNAYAYARNNPLRFIDPFGTDYILALDDYDPVRLSNNEFIRLQMNPGAGYRFNGVFIQQLRDGVWVTIGRYYNALSVFAGDTGRLADRWLRESLTDMAASTAIAATGGLAAGAFGSGLAATSTLGLDATSITGIANVTAKGARMANYAVNLSARAFQSNLMRSGYKIIQQGVGPNGPFTVLAQGEKTYTIYTASSTGGPTALVRVAGQTVSKIRLGGF